VPWCQTNFQNGAIGGALSFMLTEIGMLFAGLYYLPRGSLDRSNAWLAARATLAGMVMALAAWFVREQFILIPILVGAVVYGALVLLLRVIAPADINLLKHVAQGIANRARKPSVVAGVE
jgi:hypothetical protein